MADIARPEQNIIDGGDTFIMSPADVGVEAHEMENPADDGSWVGIVADVTEDILEQQVPGSIVILIIAAIYAPSVFKLLTHWFGRSK